MNPNGALLTPDARTALRAAGEETPEWRAWLALLECALAAADETAWREAGVLFPRARPEDAPLLHRAELLVSGAAATDLASALLARAFNAAAPAVAETTALMLIQAGVTGSAQQLASLAAQLGLEQPRVAIIAHFAAMPLLLSVGVHARPLVPADWRSGGCPVCGAWPTLAELRGLERQRVLRCGRCAAAWSRGVLQCTFCDERDHRQQGALVPHEGGEFLRIDTCASCLGYLKCFTTLRARPAWSIPLDDLRTLPLELKALERGFVRPGNPTLPDVLIRAPAVS